MDIQHGEPPRMGFYLTYTVPEDYVPAYAHKQVLWRSVGMWEHPHTGEPYRREVKGWIGPLPEMPILGVADSE